MPKVNIDSDKCTVCGTCVDTCPMEVFAKKEDSVVPEKEDACVGCRACEVQCPTSCIKVED